MEKKMICKSCRRSDTKRIQVIVISAILICISTLACNNNVDRNEKTVIKLKFSYSGMPMEPPALTATHMLDLVEAKTNGRVKIQRFMGGSLGNSLEHLDLVSSGAVDIISLQFDQFPENLPLHMILNTEHLATGKQALENNIALTRNIPETAALLAAEETQNNIKVLYWNVQGSTGITTRYPATSLNDLKGKKINVVAGYQRDVFNDLGIIPVNVQVPEIYESMSRGVIDTIFMANAAVIPLKWYELGNTHLSLGHNNVLSQAITLNLDAWNRLPGDIQRAFTEASEETAQWSIGEAAGIERETYDAFRKSGVNIVELPTEEINTFFNILFKHSLANWRKICEKKGVLDKAAVIEKYWNEMKWGNAREIKEDG